MGCKFWVLAHTRAFSSSPKPHTSSWVVLRLSNGRGDDNLYHIAHKGRTAIGEFSCREIERARKQIRRQEKTLISKYPKPILLLIVGGNFNLLGLAEPCWALLDLVEPC